MWICWKEACLLLLFFCGEFCHSENSVTPQWTSVVGLQGKSVVFPSQNFDDSFVKDEGGNTLASLTRGHLTIYLNLENRLHWNHQTGYFSLHNLTSNDSGRYIIETPKSSTKQQYQLIVYEVPDPQLKLYDKSSCIWMCYEENGSNVSLAWFKEDVLLNHTANHTANTIYVLHHISEYSSNYNCVASNPAINQTKQLLNATINQECLAAGQESRNHILICVAVLCAVCIVIVGGIICWRKRNNYIKAKSTNEEQQNDVQYSEILHSDLRPSQGRRQDVPELEAREEESTLTTLYAKIEPHYPRADSDVTGSGVLGRL
ncbi:hypothetical protein ACEWY4_007229 [Coilia grayii]|uniref:Ig-like domain-containing protein n=1 Tax=Coilia grayii TaxID=363190 RepID=A0ABD1KFW5_9TELE